MRFKLDENLPAEAAGILKSAGFDAETVGDENLSGAKDEAVATASRSEQRILVTLDLDFANIRAYPPGEHAGIVVLRVKRQDKSTASWFIFDGWPRPSHAGNQPELWIVDGNCISAGWLIDPGRSKPG